MLDNVSVNSETLFVIDFMNLKIKSLESFRDAYRVECARIYSNLKNEGIRLLVSSFC
jgi:hypothetical protein